MAWILAGMLALLGVDVASAQTANGELEGRAAPVARRKCVGGSGAGNLCNEDGDCPGSTCVDRNVFNIQVAVQFDATAAEMTDIQNLLTACSASLFDATDGQAELGEAFIYNNAFATGFTDADLRIYPATSPTWWQANTGSWRVGGSMHVSIDNVQIAPNGGQSLAHEFVHLVFDARDEYESRAAGCGVVNGAANCPDAAAGVDSCLMDQGGGTAGDFSELCWGHGNPANLTDLSAGNHDATDVTEQSVCRSNRSCWDQVVWSWPNTFHAPPGAPDPAAGGAVVHPTQFVLPDDTTRVVLVLDESGSMSLESPTRMERLQVAANDFVALAETGTELGIVSYSDDANPANGRASVAIAALGANRATWTNAVTGLAPTGWTNIGDGLQKAKDMIDAAGGVTANTFIVLMTDGINNRPSPQSTADADLQAKIDMLLAAGIPVLVTCTGSDLGLESQCAEIAAGTGGFYVDSADSARLAEAFVDIHERLSRRDAVSSYASWSGAPDTNFTIEPGSESATFTLIWQIADAKAAMSMVDPSGATHTSSALAQGRFVRVDKPLPGEWQMRIDWSGTPPSHFVKRGYVRNPVNTMVASVRYPSVLPSQPIHVFAYPLSNGGPVTDPSVRLRATVLRPDGTTDVVDLDDQGHLPGGGGGDDIDGDGTSTGVYTHTNLEGCYEFLITAAVDRWRTAEGGHEQNPDIRSATFDREARISAAVWDPSHVEGNPEDNPGKDQPGGGGGKDGFDWCRWLVFLAILIVLLLLWLLFKRK